MYLFISVFSLLVTTSCATQITFETAPRIIEASYFETLERFQKKMCGPQDEKNHLLELQRYRGIGQYIPLLKDEVLDTSTVRATLLMLAKKQSWINFTIERLSKMDSESAPKWPTRNETTIPMRDLLEQLLLLKKQNFHHTSPEEKIIFKKSSQEKLQRLTQIFEQVLEDNLFFLKNFSYPVDHLKNRIDSDHLVSTKPLQAKKEKNMATLKRRLVEDGAMEPNNTKPDVMFRTVLDTLSIHLKREHAEHDFISENTRYDLEYALNKMDEQIGWGKSVQLGRMQAWLERVNDAINFYEHLLKNEVKAQTLKAYLAENNKARQALEEFIITKEAESYDFWTKENEVMQALYALETILMNEVGSVDLPFNVERKDVARVVLNRHSHPYYVKLPHENSLYRQLIKIGLTDAQIQAAHWLNVMFKPGEFSFTYYYIPGALRVFCPEQTKIAKQLRKENVRLSIDLLQNHKVLNQGNDFLAQRYFSRASMIGRIDISTVWKNFKPLPQEAGPIVESQYGLLKAYKQGDYRYFGSFTDSNGRQWDTIEISGKTYVMSDKINREDSKGKVFHHYRNPHYFTYFQPL